jgi:deazaflavin-dependent oxidoreductase (nitroreductase family)
MPFPKALARFNRVATNRVTGAVAGWAPGFAIVHHVGRKSGKPYTTPVNAFRDGDIVTIALTYGQDSDWTKNVLAASRCEAEMGGRTVTLVDPQLVRDPSRRHVPFAVRPVLTVLRVADFLQMTVSI